MNIEDNIWYIRIRISDHGPLSSNDKRLASGICDRQKIEFEYGEMQIYIKEQDKNNNMYHPYIFGEIQGKNCWVLIDVWPFEGDSDEKVTNEHCINVMNNIVKGIIE